MTTDGHNKLSPTQTITVSHEHGFWLRGGLLVPDSPKSTLHLDTRMTSCFRVASRQKDVRVWHEHTCRPICSLIV